MIKMATANTVSLRYSVRQDAQLQPRGGRVGQRWWLSNIDRSATQDPHNEERGQKENLGYGDHGTYRGVGLVEMLRLLGNSNVCSGVHN